MSNNTFKPRDWATQPNNLYPDYKSTPSRAPMKPLIPLSQGRSELTGPVYGHDALQPLDNDLTQNSRKSGDPLGERILVSGRVVDEDGRGLAGELIEIWQANSAGRYIHVADQHDAPVDENFLGSGRCLTDADGSYSFCTIKPGAYPWPNHPNAWRPAHIHFSLFGPSIATRLVTQMYFPGDPLLELDPIFQSIPEASRDSLVSDFSIERTQHEFALGYVFDIVLRGRNATVMEG